MVLMKNHEENKLARVYADARVEIFDSNLTPDSYGFLKTWQGTKALDEVNRLRHRGFRVVFA